jgi:GntR family transcriptional regulator
MEDKKPYVMLYWDILKKLDNPYELSVYVYLKKHADHATGTCYPSIATLEKETKISEKKIRLILKDLKDKKLITIQNRTLVNGGKTSNIYKLLEFENEEIQAKPPLQGLQDEKSEQRKRVSGMDRADQSESKQDTQLNNNANLQLNDNTKKKTSQGENRVAQTKYSMDELKKQYDYAAMVAEKPEKQASIDICMDIITTIVNSKKDTIRIQKEEIQREKVVGRFLKLIKEDILWVITKFENRPNTIHSPQAYLLTLLYDAHNQRILACQNRQAVAAAAAAAPPQQTKPSQAVARGTQAFQNFTERKNNNYTSKIMDKLKCDLKEFQENQEAAEKNN